MLVRRRSLSRSKEQGGRSKKLPLYGPLEIEDYKKYWVQSCRRFRKSFQSEFPYLATAEDFKRLKVLGKGGFGVVMLVKGNSDKSYYAMKAMDKAHIVKMKQVDHVMNEKRILQCIDFPFCVRMEYFCKDNSYLYFVMPFISGGEMFTHLQKCNRFEESVAKFYAAQVVLGLEYMHTLNLVYRDLKPENLLIDHSGYLKITDFGFTKTVVTRTYTFCGTPQYIAPEVITGHGYGSSVDWWSLGVLIFEMNSGNPPYNGRNQMAIYKQILINKYTMPPYFNQALKSIIQNLLEVDVTKRYGNLKNGAEDIKNHQWFDSINWLIIFNRRMKAPFVPKIANEDDLTYFPGGDKDTSTELKISSVCQFENEFKDF